MRRRRVPVGLVFGTHLQGFVSDNASQRILIARHDDGDAFENVGKGNGGGRFLLTHFRFFTGLGRGGGWRGGTLL